MSDKLEKARKIINEVDAKMAELFVERMRATELVYEHKKGGMYSHKRIKKTPAEAGVILMTGRRTEPVTKLFLCICRTVCLQGG